MASYDYSKQLSNLKKAQQKAQTAELQNVRNQALSNLNAEQAQNTANYAAQRSSANAQNRLSARNFQEYLASTGRANSGLGAQANMQYNNNLNTSLNNIYGAENAANADVLRRITDAKNAYSTGLAAANANIEANYIQALMNEKDKAFNRQLQEKQYKESIRQFNENLKLQKQKLFSSGSGGGSSYRRTYRGNNNNNNNNDDKTFKKTNYTVDAPTGTSSSLPSKVIGGMSFATTPVYQKGSDLFYKNEKGKMTLLKKGK